MNLSEKLMRFHFFFKAFVAYIDLNFAALGIIPATRTVLDNMWTAWGPVYDAYTNPNTHGTITITDMIALYLEDLKYTEAIKKQVLSNLDIVLTGADYANLDITKPTKKRAKVPPLKYAPSVACFSIVHLLPSFFAFDPFHPTFKRKPKDVAKIGVKIAWTKVDEAAPLLKDYQMQIPENTTEFEFPVTSDKVGLRLWVICFYLSPTGEAGPDSEPIFVVII